MIQLAHHTQASPSEIASPDSTLFRWNRTDISQFLVVDPLGQGWRAQFVACSGVTPEHIELVAPEWTNAVGPVFLLVGMDLSTTDHEITVTHDLIDPSYQQQLGVVHRYEGSQDFVASLWDTAAGVGVTRVEAMEGGIPSTLYVGPDSHVLEGPASIVRTQAIAMRGLYGCGMGRVVGMGLGADSSLHTDPTVGFVVMNLSKTGVGGGEVVRIFDFVARTPGGN